MIAWILRAKSWFEPMRRLRAVVSPERRLTCTQAAADCPRTCVCVCVCVREVFVSWRNSLNYLICLAIQTVRCFKNAAMAKAVVESASFVTIIVHVCTNKISGEDPV